MSGILIKGIKVHRGDCWGCPCLDGEYGECNVLEKDVHYVDKADCPIIELPDHGDLIERDALFERTAEWEAQALHMCEVTMHDEDTTAWKRWSAILTERSAFKYDVADAPTVIPAERSEDE